MWRGGEVRVLVTTYQPFLRSIFIFVERRMRRIDEVKWGCFYCFCVLGAGNYVTGVCGLGLLWWEGKDIVNQWVMMVYPGR
jgi:hypothetical protein